MTRDGTVGRSDGTERSLPLHWETRSRLSDEASVRGLHQGQQSSGLREQAGHHDCKRLLCGTRSYLLPGGGHPHMKRRDFITLLGGASPAFIRWRIIVRSNSAKAPVSGNTSLPIGV